MTTTTRPIRLRDDSAATKWANVDWSLIVLVLATVAIGSVAIHSATRSEAAGFGLAGKQILFTVVGIGVMAAVAMIDYARLRLSLALVAGATVLVLLAVLTPLGTEIKGTQGWFVLAGFSIQPAEFAKLSLIVLLAAIFTGRTGNVEAPRIALSLVVLGVVSVLVLAQGETGSVLVYCSIALGIYLVAGMPARVLWLLVFSAIGVFSIIFTSGVLQEYQQDRLTSFIDQDADAGASYNQRQSVNAIGSGGLTGKGLFEGPQTQFGFVPEQETDFIFTVIGEELGFVGAAAVLLLEGLILLRIFRIAQLARDGFGTLLCVGVFSMLLIHVVQNVGMTMRLMPITGIPLPFVSYGGSSLITGLLAVGLVQSVAVHRRRGTL
jgi:rod shape determining protein RodA